MNWTLFGAEQANDCEAARRLILNGVSPYATAVDSDPVVDYAAADGRLAFVKLLLSYMPNLPHRKAHEYLQRAKNVALDRAIVWGTLKEVKNFVAMGADVNNLDGDDDAGVGSPLMRATYRGSLPLMRYLLAHGARVNVRDQYGRTALMYTANTNMYYSTDMHDLDDTRDSQDEGPIDAGPTRLLLRQAARVDALDKEGRTALMYATQGNPGAVRLLLTHGAQVNRRDSAGRTALLWAASDRDAKSLALLAANGAWINTQDKNGETALMLASVVPDTATPLNRAERQSALRVLRRHGAETTVKDTQGRAAEDYAKMHDEDFVSAS